MNNKKVWLVGLSALVLAACSSQRELPDGDFDYVNIPEREQLILPEGFLEVEDDHQFSVPELASGQRGGPVGDQVNIRSPRQILTMAPGSRVDEGSREMALQFDAVEGVDNLPGWIWNELNDVLQDMGAPIAESEEEARIRTETFRMEQFSRAQRGFFNRISRNRDYYVSEQAFDIELDVASHRRSATLSVTATDIAWLENDRRISIPAMLKRDLEANLLNQVSLKMERTYRADRVALTSQTSELKLGENAEGQGVYTLESDFNSVWVLMPGMFQGVGLEVEDLNQTAGMYYTEYHPGGRVGWLRRLFRRGGEQGPLNLRRGAELEFAVDEIDGTVYITPQRDGEPVSNSEIEAWFPAFSRALAEQD